MGKENLKSKKRDVFGRKTNKFRKDGLVPAVLYGKKVEAQNIWVNEIEMEKMLKKVGENTIFNLEIEGKKEKLGVIVNEIQREPVKGVLLHIDFFKVKMDEKIETEAELNFVGVSPAVKELGGILVKNLTEVPIRCLPADLPGEVNVDISGLKTFDDKITVGDLNLLDKIEVLIDQETSVAMVEEPRSQEELDKLEEKVEEDVSKVEGVTKEGEEAEGEAKEGDKKEAKPEEK